MPKLNWNKVSGDIINSFKGEPLEVYSGQEQSLVLKTMPVGMSVCLVQIYILKTTDKWLELMEYYCHLKWDSQNNHIEYEGSMNRKWNAINMSTGLPGPVEEWTEEVVLQGCSRTRPWGCSPPFYSPGMHLIWWPVLLAGLPGWLRGKDSACNAGDMDSIPGSGRSPGGGHGNPLQCSCLENPVDRGACWATVHGLAELDTIEVI